MLLAWMPKAMTDREAIMAYIARDNPAAAMALDDEFEARAERARLHPTIYKQGRVRGTREIVVRPNYVMIYRIGDDAVIILRVLHTALSWP
ncbi:MAG TPA: type II toxin-antitoxin system RelE/ParE family toxin [Luteibacter sp.]|jgi:addiction module RelE/StbE family toxin|nr:type II toxin-antitoxin system RelE/ParE family toxin [Luteibacter sp.]